MIWGFARKAHQRSSHERGARPRAYGCGGGGAEADFLPAAASAGEGRAGSKWRCARRLQHVQVRVARQATESRCWCSHSSPNPTLCRKRCGGKVASLCKLLKFQHGRTRYQKRKIEAATVTDVRCVHRS